MIYELRSKLMSSNEHMTSGRFSYGCPAVRTFAGSGHLTIGAFSSIADEVTILLGGNHNDRAVTTYPLSALWENDGLPEFARADRLNVTIGNDVWIGYGALLLPGVSVGDGAVVGAHSVVTKNVPAFAVVAGNPAEVKRYRFEPAIVEALLRIRWWDWPIEKIRAKAKELAGDAKTFAEENL